MRIDLIRFLKLLNFQVFIKYVCMFSKPYLSRGLVSVSDFVLNVYFVSYVGGMSYYFLFSIPQYRV